MDPIMSFPGLLSRNRMRSGKLIASRSLSTNFATCADRIFSQIFRLNFCCTMKTNAQEKSTQNRRRPRRGLQNKASKSKLNKKVCTITTHSNVTPDTGY
jgi:hypothetical protein